MIRVIVELLPGGREDYAATIAVAGIANAVAPAGRNVVVRRYGGREWVGTVEGHRCSEGVWALLASAALMVDGAVEDVDLLEAVRDRLPAVPGDGMVPGGGAGG